MQCDEMADRLTQLMEGELESADETAALEHLASCERCDSVLTATRDVVRLAHDHGRPALDYEARARMLGSIVAELDVSAES